MQDELQQRGLAVIRATLSDQVAALSDDAALAAVSIEQLGLDSLVKLDLVLQLETEFSTMANENEIAECETFGELILVIAKSRAEA